MRPDRYARIAHGALLVVSAAAAILGSAAEQTYSVRDLGVFTNPPGREDGRPQAINNRGQVVAANASGGVYRALLWGRSWTNLGTLGGAEGMGFGISDDGRVVGQSTTAGGATHAFLWTPGGTNGIASNRQMKDLGTLGGTSSAAYGINSSTQITGYARTSSSDHAFRWTGGILTDIGASINSQLTLALSSDSYGSAINSSGVVAGTVYDARNGTAHAFLYSGSKATDLGHLGGGEASAQAINSIGHVVGYSMTTGDVEHAFIHNGVSMVDLGTLGGRYSYAQCINRHDVIVGGSFADPQDTVFRAFVHADGRMTDLNSQLDASGTGWTLIEARAINDVNQIIGVGSCTGVMHGFILNPVFAITNLAVASTNVVVTFTTVNHVNHALKGADALSSPSWTNVVTNITGNGASVAVTNASEQGRPLQFYRVDLVPP